MQAQVKTVVSVRNLTKEYRRGRTIVRALEDATLEVKTGEFCAFVGPSGCGKKARCSISSEDWIDPPPAQS